MDRREAERVLAKGLWLAHEPPAIARAVLGAARQKKVPAGTRIYDAEARPAGLVGLCAGQIRLDIVSGLEDPTLFALVTPGFILSNLPVPGGLTGRVSATAGTDCTLLVVPTCRLGDLARETDGLDRALTRLATLNLWTTLEIVSALRRQSNAERVAALLVTLAGVDLADGWRIDVPQADLASMAAPGRTTLVAALRELESKGLVETEYRSIWLLDVAGLVALRDGA